MVVRAFACPLFRKRRALPALGLGAFLAMTTSAMTTGAMAQGQAGPFALECAEKEIMVITLIEDHGAADDVPSGRLGAAGLTLQRARSSCKEGRVAEALTLYQSVLDLGPVASLRQQQP